MSEQATVGATWLGARRALLEHSNTPGLDAQLLLCEVMNRDRAWLLTHPEAPLETDQLNAFCDSLRRCLAGEALPYVLGWWEFYGRRFEIQPHVLIPRPETELLVEHALSYLEANTQRDLVLDVGTGSGCIAITLAIEMPQLQVVATDLDRSVLQIASKNAVRHGVGDRIRFIQGDLASALAGPYDLICTNLPYIPSARLSELVVGRREPQVALDGGPDGLVWIRSLLEELPRLLEPGGKALFEIDEDQRDAVLADAAGSLLDARVQVCKDLAGKDRLLIIDRQYEEGS
ncbi:MAG: peptide chain release factor N(5)-glutamine methyltransferase [Anaerolineales bacterium]|jgi:release factor glutamine methyltransferase